MSAAPQSPNTPESLLQNAPLLRVEHLSVRFEMPDHAFDVVRDISFSLDAGRTLCLVGESGCGKSVTALSILRLLPKPVGRIAGGSILFDGKDLASQ